jgi:hypothetical protein
MLRIVGLTFRNFSCAGLYGISELDIHSDELRIDNGKVVCANSIVIALFASYLNFSL